MCPAARCCRLFCLCVSISPPSTPPLPCMHVCAPHRREQHDIGCAAGAAPHNGDLQQHYALCACVQHQHKGAAGTNHSVMPLHWMERGVLQGYICTIGEGCAASVHMSAPAAVPPTTTTTTTTMTFLPSASILQVARGEGQGVDAVAHAPLIWLCMRHQKRAGYRAHSVTVCHRTVHKGV